MQKIWNNFMQCYQIVFWMSKAEFEKDVFGYFQLLESDEKYE